MCWRRSRYCRIGGDSSMHARRGARQRYDVGHVGVDPPAGSRKEGVEMKNIGCLAVVGVLVVLALVGVGSYNGLVSAREAVDSQWANVENVYQRRADLIPNLVASVKGAA